MSLMSLISFASAFAARPAKAPTSCISPPRALDRLAGKIHPALVAVLSDINMPGMDGLQLLGEIKQRFPDLPVMMVTAYGDDARRRQATEYGADKCGSCPARRSRNKHGQRCALFGFAATDRSIFARATASCLPQSQYRRGHPGPYRRAQARSAQCRALRPNWSNRAGDQSAAGKARLIDSGERTQIDA